MSSRRWPLKTTTVTLAATGAVLAAYGLIVALAIKPPLLGWIGFAIASTVVLDASCSGGSSAALSQQGRRS
jgi:hypothetical protein